MIDGFNLPVAIEMMVSVEQARQAPLREGDRHDQSSWGELQVALNELDNSDLAFDRFGRLIGVASCGTARCAAGWVMSNARVPLKWDRLGSEKNGLAKFTTDTTADGQQVDVAASRLLGMIDADDDYYDEDAYWYDEQEGYPTLFRASNTVDDLYRIVADYAGVPEAEVRNQVTSRLNLVGATR